MHEKLTAVLWHDRHTGTVVHLFTDRIRAEGWASSQSRQLDRFGDYREERYGDDIHFVYSCEDDRLEVTDIEVDEEAHDA